MHSAATQPATATASVVSLVKPVAVMVRADRQDSRRHHRREHMG
jgi:hypothetical protein